METLEPMTARRIDIELLPLIRGVLLKTLQIHCGA
jgi:hypothetical protein